MKMNVLEKIDNRKLIIAVSIIFAIMAVFTTVIIVVLSHRENVGDILALGDRYMSEMDYEAAIREYRHAIEIDPKSEDAYIKLAEAYIAMGDIASAIDALEEGYEETQSERILERLNELRGEGQTSPVAERVVMASTPQKTTYYVGETLDLTGLTLTVTYSDGTTEEISEGYTCDVKTLDEAGTVEVTVWYGEAETTVTVTVVDVPDTGTDNTEPLVTETIETEPSTNEPSVTEPTETVPPKTESPTTEPSGTEAPETEPPTMEAPVTVSPTATLTGISIKTQPTKTTYNVGDTLDTTGLTLTATYSDGKMEMVTSGFTCSPTTLNTAGTQTITVTYGGKTTTLDVMVTLRETNQESHSGTYGDLLWELDDGVLTIFGNGEMNLHGDTDTTWKKYSELIEKIIIVDGVTSIANEAFWECYNLISVIIPSSVTSIGDSAFHGCTSLMSITIPASVTIMGSGVFSACSKLNNIYINSNVIGHRAFEGCDSLSSVKIPSNVQKWDGAFFGCTGLKSVIIEDGVTNIGNETFWECYNLTSVIIPPSVTSIDDSAFIRCNSLENIIIPSSVAYIKSGAFTGSGLTSILIPNSVVDIGSWVFSECENLKEVKIESSVLGFQTFAGCNKLKSITIPSCLKEWDYAFYGCLGLSNVQFENGVTNVAEGAFVDCKNLLNIDIPNSITTIESSAFSGSGLTVVAIPKETFKIGDGAFRDCNNLIDIYINNMDCVIENYSIGKTLGVPGTTIVHGYTGSTANVYAQSWGYEFKAIN